MSAFLHDFAHRLLYEQGDANAQAQVQRLIDVHEPQIDGSHLGFFDIYYALSVIIPKGRVVYDLGCHHAIQAWFFREHKGYVGVDHLAVRKRFKQHNASHVQADIETWIVSAKPQRPSFAILSYVPNLGDLDTRAFPDVFRFYPEHGDHPEWDNLFRSLSRSCKAPGTSELSR